MKSRKGAAACKEEPVRRFPVALTIAGSDSGGGAGIQADLRAFRAAGVYGCSAIAAITAQNPKEVLHIEPVPLKSLRLQLKAISNAFSPGAVKTGMLFSAGRIRAVCSALKQFDCPVVADPVMVSTSGIRLLKEDAEEAVRRHLLPAADWITPNIPEAELLLGRRLRSFPELLDAAAELAGRFRCAVILKGGHADDDPFARDAVCLNGTLFRLSSPRIPALPHAAHGTGCTFSASLAAWLAKGKSGPEALLLAKTFVYESLLHAGLISRETGAAIAGMPPDLNTETPNPDVELEKI